MTFPRLHASAWLLAAAPAIVALAAPDSLGNAPAQGARFPASLPHPSGGTHDARPQEPSRSAARYALLWLDVEPGDSQVALDGEFLDRGVWLISLSPGLHDLSVRKEGFRPYSRRIGINPGESLRLKVSLDPDPGAR